MSSAQSPARSPKPVVRRPFALAPRPATTAPRASGGRRVDVATIADDLRCDCGRLLAKVVAGGLEIRCTRCKASHVLAWSEVEGARELLGDAIAPADARSTDGLPHDP